MRSRIVPGAIGLLVAALWSVPARGQDLFELEIFRYDTAAPGEYEVAFHTNLLSRGGVAADRRAGNHHPVHMSVEATRGWTSRWETAVFLQTAPFGASGSARFAGGHLRTKLRLAGDAPQPVRLAVTAEYSFNAAAFDGELQAFEITPIIDFERGRLSLVANPSVEFVTRGGEKGEGPVFDVAAGAAWRLTPRVALTTDYFPAAAATRHLQPELAGHHLLFAGVDVDLSPTLGLSVGGGHCVNRTEPWVLKSIVAVRF